MGLKKNGVKEGNHRLQDSGLFDTIDNVITTNQMGNIGVNCPVPLNYETRKLELAPKLKAEYWKAQAITLIRQNFYK